MKIETNNEMPTRRRISGAIYCSQFCSQPNGLNSTQWTRYEYMESQNFEPVFNCCLICKQRVPGRVPLGSSYSRLELVKTSSSRAIIWIYRATDP